MSNPDPWKDRNVKMKCSTCIWFMKKGDDLQVGRCRKRSPSMEGFPVVFSADWCGSHKLDENKIRKN